MKDFYAILDIPVNASQDEIKEQYRFLAHAWHPDKFPNPGQKAKAEEKIKEINGAYEILSNPNKRGQYDRERQFQAGQSERVPKERPDKERAEAPRRHPESERNRASQAGKPLGRNELRLSLVPGVEMVFVRVPSGEFLFGDRNWSVFLDEFWIGKYPVTNAQFRVFLKASNFPYGAKLPEGAEDHPVVQVTWAEAVAFCSWASRVSGQPVRLPTEAEWEKAARGVDGRTYPWGDQAPNASLANYSNYVGDTTRVGKYPLGASPYGALDMAGNVWEWVKDWAGNHTSPPPGNPSGPSRGIKKVLRGGSWGYRESDLYVANRLGAMPVYRESFVGFRCAAVPGEKTT